MTAKRMASATIAEQTASELLVESLLKQAGLEIAKTNIQEELQSHVANWIASILRSDAPEHVRNSS